MVLRGRVQSGKGDAARWLTAFNDAYARKTGVPVFPGSLNVALDVPFEWSAPTLRDRIILFRGEEFGGERDILMLPCKLRTLGSQRAFLWITTNTVTESARRNIVEIIASVGLRDAYGLQDGDVVEVEILPAAGSLESSLD
jgi:CTP-dependent riboflavin kinase